MSRSTMSPGIVYTPLNKSMAQIIREIQGKGLLIEPYLGRFPIEKENNWAYCLHHNIKGHSTNGCRDLREQVEDLVKNDYLSEYVEQVATKTGQR